MAEKIRETGRILKQTFQEFLRDDCLLLAAAIAYYAIFSLPGILVIVIRAAGAVFHPEDVRGQVAEEMERAFGQQATEQIRALMQSASETGEGTFATVVGIGTLLFAATTAFAEIQRALNTVWGVQPDPQTSSIKSFFMKRLLSFLTIVIIAALLLTMLLLGAALSVIQTHFQSLLPEGSSGPLLVLGNTAISWFVAILLFAFMFKVFPDADLHWHDVAFGAGVTGTLFVIGKLLIGTYLTRQGAGLYGATAALLLVLLWIYYSTMILLAGAEFTQVWATRHGKGIPPSSGAVSVPKGQQPPHSDR